MILTSLTWYRTDLLYDVHKTRLEQHLFILARYIKVAANALARLQYELREPLNMRAIGRAICTEKPEDCVLQLNPTPGLQVIKALSNHRSVVVKARMEHSQVDIVKANRKSLLVELGVFLDERAILWCVVGLYQAQVCPYHL